MATRKREAERPAVTWKTFSFHSHPRAVKAVNERARTIEHLISTQTVDRDGEVLRSKGCVTDLYLRNNPVVFWNHAEKFARGMEHELPIGRALDVHVGDQEVSALTAFAGKEQMHDFAARVFLLYRDRFLNSWSVGFEKAKATRDRLVPEQTGQTVWTWPLLEYSSVGLPSNAGAITQFMKHLSLPDGATEADLGKALGAVPLAKYWQIAEQILPAAGTSTTDTTLTVTKAVVLSDALIEAGRVDAEALARDFADRAEKAAAEADPLRWNRDLSAKLFDVTRERSPASTGEVELAARYLDCEVKELRRRGAAYGGTRMGAGLVALDEAVGAFEVEDVRNFVHLRGPDQRAQQAEAPLEHDVVRLNSRLRRSFLLGGTRFMRSERGRLVVRVEPDWRGVALTVYAKDGLGDVFLERLAERAAQLKFYKGESFSLSGEFIEPTDESWDDVFLTEKNERALRVVVDLVNAHGAAMENRGVVMLGEPGTGKTLATRVIRNETRGGDDAAPATFVWVSARDFHRMGAFGGIEHAFDVAKENAPSILVFEDVDNWIGRGEIDLLKTTMDGVARTRGIATILTTNDPAHFPPALLDRPGRFHDVLKIDLPDADQRARMLARWAPDLSEASAKLATEGMEGYSGAHVRELARFASIIREQDGVKSPDDAIALALAKVREQRDLIAEVHAERGRYAPRAAVADAVKAAEDDEDAADLELALAAEARASSTSNAVTWAKVLQLSTSNGGAEPAVEGAKSYLGFEAIGYTSPAAGASSPLHVHDYELDGEGGELESGCAKHVADHSHRITQASLSRGETEPSDGHVHRLMTSADVAAALVERTQGVEALLLRLADAAGDMLLLGGHEGACDGAVDEACGKHWSAAERRSKALRGVLAEVREALGGFDVKDGRVLSSANEARLRSAYDTIGEVLAAHAASRARPEPDPALPATPGQVPHAPAKSLADEIAAALGAPRAAEAKAEAEAWFDGGALGDLRERFGGAPVAAAPPGR